MCILDQPRVVVDHRQKYCNHELPKSIDFYINGQSDGFERLHVHLISDNLMIWGSVQALEV